MARCATSRGTRATDEKAPASGSEVADGRARIGSKNGAAERCRRKSLGC